MPLSELTLAACAVVATAVDLTMCPWLTCCTGWLPACLQALYQKNMMYLQELVFEPELARMNFWREACLANNDAIRLEYRVLLYGSAVVGPRGYRVLLYGSAVVGLSWVWLGLRV